MLCFIILFTNLFVYTYATCPSGQIPSKFADPPVCYSFEKAKANWFAAMENCTEKGGNLVSFHSMFENMFVNGEAGNFFTDSSTSDFWIGGIYNTISPGKWSWIDNSTFDFFDWDKGQPQNTTDSVCASAIMNGAKWQSEDCFIDKPFVCEIKQLLSTSPTTTTTTTTTKKPNICPDSWIYYNSSNFCYKAFQMYKTCNACDWSVQAWIGLSRIAGNFQWTDGTPFDYSSWVHGRPVSDSRYQCVESWIGQTCDGDGWDLGPTEWANQNCDVKILNFICKKGRIS
uniref:C-type lectin domain-containing protein n=1 Tax=Panagrolaimus davidi TaxID=227884 RepID=A0A914QEI7_9BILA